jgi:hypothetical protein
MVGHYNRNTNDGPLEKPFPLTAQKGEDSITISKTDVTAVLQRDKARSIRLNPMT